MKLRYDAIVLGVSAGGLKALQNFLPRLPKNFSVPLIIVQHISERSENLLLDILKRSCKLHVKEIEDKGFIEAGCVYIAPPGYHVLLENDHSFSLSVDDLIHYSRPSIDVLFESAALVYEHRLIAVLLTGASEDGARGLKKIQEMGGVVVVQDPHEAEVSVMPAAGLRETKTEHVMPLSEIASFLMRLLGDKHHKN